MEEPKFLEKLVNKLVLPVKNFRVEDSEHAKQDSPPGTASLQGGVRWRGSLGCSGSFVDLVQYMAITQCAYMRTGDAVGDLPNIVDSAREMSK